MSSLPQCLQRLSILYKMTSTGAIQMWEVECYISSRQIPYYKIYHGQVDGKLQTTETEIPYGKNIGKTNETTPWEQCCLEAKSLWNKQKDRKGYSQTVPEEKPLRPMLAKSYNKDGHHIKFPCYLQPKMDGGRCLAKRTKDGVELLSRQDKRFTSLPHIEKQLMWLPIGTILDGELYVHGENFQNLISAFKRNTPSSESSNVQYHIYDMINEWDYEKRLSWLSERLPARDYIGSTSIHSIHITHIFLVKTYKINNKREVWKYHKQITREGYEGVMLRNLKGPYKINGRSKDLQKVKKFIDMEFEIVGAEQNKGKMSKQCSLICKTEEGETFKVKPKGTDAQREQYWTDYKAGKLTGKMLTVRFFAWSTSKKPLPIFQVGIAVRNYEG